MGSMLLCVTRTSVHPPQLADRTESLNRSIQKRFVYVLSGILEDRVEIRGCGALRWALGGLGGLWKVKQDFPFLLPLATV